MTTAQDCLEELIRLRNEGLWGDYLLQSSVGCSLAATVLQEFGYHVRAVRQEVVMEVNGENGIGVAVGIEIQQKDKFLLMDLDGNCGGDELRNAACLRYKGSLVVDLHWEAPWQNMKNIHGISDIVDRVYEEHRLLGIRLLQAWMLEHDTRTSPAIPSRPRL